MNWKKFLVTMWISFFLFLLLIELGISLGIFAGDLLY